MSLNLTATCGESLCPAFENVIVDGVSNCFVFLVSCFFLLKLYLSRPTHCYQQVPHPTFNLELFICILLAVIPGITLVIWRNTLDTEEWIALGVSTLAW